MSQSDPAFFLLSLAFVFLFGYWLGRLSKGRSSAPRADTPRATTDAPPAEGGFTHLTADQRTEIETLIGEDRKIEAIRACRAALGLGFDEAHALVKEIERSITRGGAGLS